MDWFRKQYLEMYEKEFQKHDQQNKQIVVKKLDDTKAVEVYIQVALKHGYKLIQQSGSQSILALRGTTTLTFQKQ